MFGRSLDRALEASEQRHQAFVREFAREIAEREHERERRRERFEREMEQRYSGEVQLTREVLRRHEIIFKEVLGALGELRGEVRAQTNAIFRLIDRLENGGEAAAS